MDRKELIRACKEARRPMGIYRVRNTIDGRSLVGSSIDLPSMLNRHRTQLKFRGHRNEALQRDWDVLGPDAFAFEVVDTLTPPADDPGYDPTDDLRVLEELWLERLDPFDERGYMTRRRR
jgi:hypothetical protein